MISAPTCSSSSVSRAARSCSRRWSARPSALVAMLSYEGRPSAERTPAGAAGVWRAGRGRPGRRPRQLGLGPLGRLLEERVLLDFAANEIDELQPRKLEQLD